MYNFSVGSEVASINNLLSNLLLKLIFFQQIGRGFKMHINCTQITNQSVISFYYFQNLISLTTHFGQHGHFQLIHQICKVLVIIQCVPLATETDIEDIAKKFEHEYVRCVRNEEECVCCAPNCCDTEQRSANQW